ncbi:glycosyltransferase family 4 protein [Rhizobium bangladeshense]|uniref:glycosyltransferase family 4 protein n=1 Tax=Rhizobium bangladeshense TaxID=1138189 RepID=UPI001A99712D|nr:glycosyltransferase family 4 protein [Rhizobium bangladeshense]MBX4897723.1 glycosyltransferase family 4 protein [Rhizobium bangladeshense]MBX4904391.1 glycosyltransferase family 4 protein [Rhizobium bangladeshense]MBX4916792.1 glycosyltransferase family 4 protein [Rhizobium bangladeshense]MBX4933233.1 glycosyltransferase family 4 protein [Rhizobium bangladeshense]MBY3583277.1 glycosyltransferase family 4 protein [Rhizobium bangladeshense]
MRKTYRFLRAHVLQRLIPRSRVAFNPRKPVEIIGYLSMPVGVGESARLCAGVLSEAGRAILLSDVSTHPDEKSFAGWAPPHVSNDLPGSRIWHLNPPMLPRAIAKKGLANFTRTFNIGYFAWELEVVPAEWRNGLRYMNAVFVPSEFTRRAIAPLTAAPVIVVPHPVIEKPAAEGMREKFGVEKDAFLVSFIFSAGSSINRKNPQAVIEAFRLFSAECPSAFLLMKASGDIGRDEGLRELIASVAGNARIKIVTDKLSNAEINGLIRSSDAYLSLHRSEGFGLTVAEAIMHRTPVVSTAWSGTEDFCDPENSWLVASPLIPVVDSHPEFAGLPSAVWANPSPEIAAAHLGDIFRAPERAREKATKAREFLLRYLAENSYEKALQKLAAMQAS